MRGGGEREGREEKKKAKKTGTCVVIRDGSLFMFDAIDDGEVKIREARVDGQLDGVGQRPNATNSSHLFVVKKKLFSPLF